MMDKTQFWQLIEASQNKKRDCDRQAAKLEKLLAKQSVEEVAEFDNIFHTLMRESYRSDLWAVAYIVNSGCSDDAFEYFRCWLIAQGQSYFEAAMQNPERAADGAKPEETECEAIWYVASQLYESKTGVPLHEVAERLDYPNEPFGQPWREEDVDTLYPALWKRFG